MTTITIVCIALMGVLLFVLGANVTRWRVIRGKNGGPQASTDPADRLLIAVRAHGNAAEYIPTMIVLLLVCSALSDSWWVDALSVAALVVRTVHAVGMLTAKTLAAHGPLRDIGALGTYLVGITLGITAIAVI
ncbi:MAPEG family protein [Kribbella sp. NPDC051718]|uniref:MAPEG family protein n=1 Tax=Kribbella sp. NPDC051718 TaxID=3155168 RepID=UPI00342D66DE